MMLHILKSAIYRQSPVDIRLFFEYEVGLVLAVVKLFCYDFTKVNTNRLIRAESPLLMLLCRQLAFTKTATAINSIFDKALLLFAAILHAYRVQ